MRSDTNDLRLFEELRLHPWKAQDKLKIDAQLAMLGVTNPQKAADMTSLYTEKMDAYLAKKASQKVVHTISPRGEPLTIVTDGPPVSPPVETPPKETAPALEKPKKKRK